MPLANDDGHRGGRPATVLRWSKAMKPNFLVRQDNTPAATWEDPGDPRFFLAHFLGSEVYLALYKADEFLQAVDAVERGEVESWRWCGNSFSVQLSKGR